MNSSYVDVEFRNESTSDEDSVVNNIERLFRGRRVSILLIDCWGPDDTRNLSVDIDPASNPGLYPALRIEGQRIVLCGIDLAGATVMQFTAGRSTVEVVLRLHE